MFLYGVGVQVRHGRTDRGLIVLVCVGAAYGMAALLFTPSTYYVRFAFVPLFGYSAFVALGVARLLERLREPLSRARWITVSAAIVVLFVGEAANLTLRQTIYTDSLKYTRLTSPEMAFLAKLGPKARVIDEYENEHQAWLGKFPFERQAFPRWLVPAYSGAETFSRVGVSFVIGGFQAFYDRALRGAYFGVRPGDWSPLLNLAAVTHRISPEPPGTSFDIALRGPDYAIARNPQAMPRVQLYPRAEIAADATGLDDLESSAGSSGAIAAVIAPENAADMKPLDASATGFARIVSYSDERVEMAADVTGRSLLVLADTYHPGWRAWIDGKPSPLLRANVAFRGLIVEPGAHTIELRFAPPYRTLLLALAVIALVVHVCVGCLWTAKRLRSARTTSA